MYCVEKKINLEQTSRLVIDGLIIPCHDTAQPAACSSSALAFLVPLREIIEILVERLLQHQCLQRPVEMGKFIDIAISTSLKIESLFQATLAVRLQLLSRTDDFIKAG